MYGVWHKLTEGMVSLILAKVGLWAHETRPSTGASIPS